MKRKRFSVEQIVAVRKQAEKGEDVVRVLNRVKITRGVPKMMHCDNGSEFCSQAMDLWAISTECGWRFRVQGNRPTMRSWIRSTEPSDQNA